MPDADVYQGDRLVAHLDRTPEGIALTYLPSVQLDHGSLAVSLPKSEAPIVTPDLHPFFLNLLPEGARLRLLLESSRSQDDSLGLLMRLGWDTIGDVAVLPHGTPPGGEPSVSHVRLAQADFWDLFQRGAGERPDAAIPGVQEKISSSTVAFGVRTANVPSAILKLNPVRYPRLVHNEAFFTKMARDCGLETCRSEVVHDRLDEPGLLVRRFDRTKEGKLIRKLHQEDGCQLLGLPPAHKYHTSLRQIAEAVARTATAPMVELERLIRLYAFCWLIGNADLHAKNLSLLWDGAVRLSPAYDILSTLPYPLERGMALKMDAKDARFRITDFATFGVRFGIRERALVEGIRGMASRAKGWTDRLGEIGFDATTTSQMRSEIVSRIERISG